MPMIIVAMRPTPQWSQEITPVIRANRAMVPPRVFGQSIKRTMPLRIGFALAITKPLIIIKHICMEKLNNSQNPFA